jgi:predicted HNH restriction endonuclease
MDAPSMRAYVESLVGQTVYTAVENRPNTIVEVRANQAIVRTQDGTENPASLVKLQQIADAVWAGEEVTLETRGRSAFHMAVLITRPEIEHTVGPRRVRLRDADNAFDVEYAELFPGQDPVSAREGRVRYRQHRVRERSAVLRRMKKEAVLAQTGRLACEVCGFDYAERYGSLGQDFIECHHAEQLADGEERETTLDDLVLLCANCHRMIHRTSPMMSPAELQQELR